MEPTFERLKELRRIVWRVVGVQLDAIDYAERVDQSAIVFKQDVVAAVKSIIRRPEAYGTKLQYLTVEIPSVHYAPAPDLEDEFSYIPNEAWLNWQTGYDQIHVVGHVYLNSVFRSKELKHEEFYRQACSHATTCSSDYGGTDCSCNLIDSVPGWVEPYVDLHFKELFKIDLDAERKRFDDHFSQMKSTLTYRKP